MFKYLQSVHTYIHKITLSQWRWWEKVKCVYVINNTCFRMYPNKNEFIIYNTGSCCSCKFTNKIHTPTHTSIQFFFSLLKMTQRGYNVNERLWRENFIYSTWIEINVSSSHHWPFPMQYWYAHLILLNFWKKC